MVLFFDSGIGGVSYLQEFQRRTSDAPVLYLADTAFFPYGDRPPDEVRGRVVSLITEMTERFPLDAVVLACNTASVVALEATRRATEIPIIGVVPAVKPAATRTRTRHIAVLATNRTANDPYTDDLVRRFADYCRVTRLGLPRLVEAAEASLCGSSDPSVRTVVEEDIVGRLDADVDTVVLACTHFIGIRDEIAAALGPQREVVDSLAGVIRRLLWILEERNITLRGEYSPRPLFLTTAPVIGDLSCLPFTPGTVESGSLLMRYE